MVRRAPLGLALLLCACADAPGVTCEREGEVHVPIETGPRDTLDLLLVIENAGAMLEAQVTLQRELPRLIASLATGDLDGDGVADFAPVRSLHAAVVSTDMGTGGFTVATCGNGLRGFEFGDDGLLQGRGARAIPSCLSEYPPIFEFAAGSGDPTRFADELSCVAVGVGTGGCGFEQQLDAMLKAISPASAHEWTAPGYVPPVFYGRSMGHADGANAGFLRPDSVLAVLMLTMEEDCSVIDPDLFNTSSERYASVDPNLRCFRFPEVSFPVERYVEGLIGLRRSPHDVVFGVIAGVPLEVQGRDAATILAHPDMEEMIDPITPTRLRPSCNRGGFITFPPRRIVSVAAGLEDAGALTTVQSICQDTFADPIDAILARIGEAMGGTDCLADDLEVDEGGRIDCDVLELVPAGMTCDALPGRRRVGEEERDGVTRELCAVDQVALTDVSAPGFFYETVESTPDTESDIAQQCGERGRRVRFTTPRVVGSDVWMDCGTCRP